MRKTLSTITFLIFFSIIAKSQVIPVGMTGLALQQAANSTIDKLKDAGTTLLGNGMIVMNDASGQVSTLLNQFNKLAGDNIRKPIEQLSSDLRNLANQLYSVTHRLDNIITQQMGCLLLNSQIIVASVESISSEVKSGIPVISKDIPRLNFFEFENHTPSIVPQDGGRIIIDGYYLWTKESLPPIVSIQNADRTQTLLTVQPERGANNNSFSFMLKPEFIKQYSGNCLQIKVQPRKTTWHFTTQMLGDFYLPMCIPTTFRQQLKLVGHLQYPCTSAKEEVVSEYKPFYFDNTSYDEVTVTHTACWTLPKEAQIIDYVFAPNSPGKRNTSNISVTHADNCITAAGTLDGASRAKVGPVTHYIHSTYWQGDIAPKISYPVSGTNISSDSTGFINMESTTTNLCVDIDKTCDGSSNIVFWFEIVEKTGSITRILYTSLKSNSSPLADDYKGLRITATLNPTPVNGKAQICVKVDKPQCGF